MQSALLPSGTGLGMYLVLGDYLLSELAEAKAWILRAQVSPFPCSLQLPAGGV